MRLSESLLQAIGVTAELTNTDLSKPALKVMAIDLSAYPEPMVLKALTRCRRELKGKLTVGEVVSRLDDGRPGPEEAWSMIPHDEGTTVVWTDEMAQAFGVANDLLPNMVQARLAFVEKYTAMVREAREKGLAPNWRVSLGHDPEGRAAPLLEAVDKGRITAAQANRLLPAAVHRDVVQRLEAMQAKTPDVERSPEP